MVYACDSIQFRGLKNPYTGEPIRVSMVVMKDGTAKFYAPDTYAPSEVFRTAADAFRHWNRVNGVEGVKTDKPVTCAYTGQPLVPRRTSDGFCYLGGFNPHLLYDRDTFLYYMRMRDGVSELPVPKKSSCKSRVTQPVPQGKVTKRMQKHADEMRTELSDDAIRAAEKTLHDIEAKGISLEKSSTVSMSKRAK